MDAGANFTNDHLGHPRSINVYDWPTTRFVLHLVSPHMGLSRRAARIGFTLAAFGLHLANVGMASNLIFAPPDDAAMLEEQTYDVRRGIKLMPTDVHLIAMMQSQIAHAPPQPGNDPGEITPSNADLITELAAAHPHPAPSFAEAELLFVDLKIFAFFALVLLVYWNLRTNNLRKGFILFASYFFYASWDWRFAIMLLGLSAADWFFALPLERTDQPRIRTLLVTASLTMNLAVLAFFKYFHFFVDSAALLAAGLHLHLSEPR